MLPLLKLLFKLRILIFLGLLFIGPGIFAQTDSNDINQEKNQQNKNQDKNQIEEDHDTKNLDNLLIDYNKNKEKVLKDAAKILEADENDEVANKELGINQNNEPADKAALKKATSTFKNIIDPKSLKKTKYSDALRVALEPLQRMSEKELVQLLKDNTSGSKASTYIDRFPKLAIFTVRLIKDKDALPNLAKILDDQERLIRFLGIMISTILIAFLLKRLMKRKGRSVVQALSFWFLRFIIISSLRFGILIYFFSSELSPLFSITSKTFF